MLTLILFVSVVIFVFAFFTYGNYLDEVWTIDDRSGSITIADLNDGSGRGVMLSYCDEVWHDYGNPINKFPPGGCWKCIALQICSCVTVADTGRKFCLASCGEADNRNKIPAEIYRMAMKETVENCTGKKKICQD